MYIFICLLVYLFLIWAFIHLELDILWEFVIVHCEYQVFSLALIESPSVDVGLQAWICQC